MPAYYQQGVEIAGQHYPTQARWQGDASRDMYVRSLPGAMLAYDMLGEGEREDRLRSVMRRQIPCTLNRLSKARIINIQSNPEIVNAVSALLGAGTVTLDPDDIDFSTLDELVLFAMKQPNPAHWDLFDSSCPDGPPIEADPELVIDAAAPTFLLDLLVLGRRVDRAADAPIAWINAASVRAGDLIFMTQWGLAAHYLTGEQQYLDFVAQLMVETEYAGVLKTYGAYRLPKWCTPHFAPSLTYPSLYNLLGRIDQAAHPELWRLLSEDVARREGRERDLSGVRDSFWGILYNRMVNRQTDPSGAAYVQSHVARLGTYGMDPTDKHEPDRNYSRNFVDNPDPAIELELPSEEVRAICEAETTVFGITVPGAGLSDEEPRAVETLPLSKRSGGGFLWTQDPWRVNREYGGSEFTKQYPMVGMTAAYWIGRSDGVIAEGQGLGLAWRDTGEACE